jgi:hypothetical protein
MKQVDKPIVRFLGKPLFYTVELVPRHQELYGQYADEDGYVEYARVFGLDHPLLGTDTIRTSVVVKKHDDGSFETLNTLYVPAEEKHESK